MVSGREMWMRGSSLRGRNPGNDHRPKAVACDAAENSVTAVKGRTKLASVACPGTNAFSGIRMPRLGEGSDRCRNRLRLTPVSTAS